MMYTEENMYLYSVEAEMSVLGSILLEPELFKECPNIPEHFTPGTHHNIFYTMCDLDKRGIPIDIVTLMDRVGKEKIDKLGGISYLSELSASIASTANFRHHCTILTEYYRKRKIVNIADQLKAEALENDSGSALAKGVQELIAVDEGTTDEDDGSIIEDLTQMYMDFESGKGVEQGLLTGYRDIDRITGGYKDGDLIIVGARPSMGKTAYAINMATNVAGSKFRVTGNVAAIFSLEMSRKQILKRAMATTGNMDMQFMRGSNKDIPDEYWNKMTSSLGELTNSDLFVYDRPGADMRYIRQCCRRLRHKFPTQRIMVVIDYLQLIRGSGNHAGNRNNEVGEISRDLKIMAREYKLVVIALSQLSRGVEQRQDKRPMMSDLRESGSIEQDADQIQFLYREDYYDKETENQNMIEVIIAKHRDGPTGNVVLAFVKEYGKFVNIDWGQSHNG